MDWHSTQNQDYISLLKSRLNGPLLHWVDQFVKIINQSIGEGGITTLNDLGCCVGNFFRGVDFLQGSINYRGYDVSDIYLSIAREFFPAGNFLKLDISEQMPQEADVTVMSATLEHLDNYTNAPKKYIFLNEKALYTSDIRWARELI